MLLDDGRVWWLDELECRKGFSYFMKLLNRKVFGKAADRYGKRLQVIPVVEKGLLPSSLLASNGPVIEKETQWHYNLAIELLPGIEAGRFQQLVQECWSHIQWSNGCWVERAREREKWIEYITKMRQKSVFEAWSDSIDWDCFYNQKP